MRRATTPVHKYYFDSDPSIYQKILITYVQNGKIVLEKTKDDLTFDTEAVPCRNEERFVAWFRLTQEESNKFSSEQGNLVQVQIRVLTDGGEALASDIKSFSVQDVLNDEVLT